MKLCLPFKYPASTSMQKKLCFHFFSNDKKKRKTLPFSKTVKIYFTLNIYMTHIQKEYQRFPTLTKLYLRRYILLRNIFGFVLTNEKIEINDRVASNRLKREEKYFEPLHFQFASRIQSTSSLERRQLPARISFFLFVRK